MEHPLIDDFRWLLTDTAGKFLENARDDFEARRNPLTIAKRLRRKTTAQRAALILDQAQLRIRARAKFELADQMFFTRRGLEQSTANDLANYKAGRLRQFRSVADICCGIGGDLAAIATASQDSVTELESDGEPRRQVGRSVVGIDQDEVTALFAGYNLDVHLKHAKLDRDACRGWVQQVAFEDLNLSDFDAVHIDPDRRVEKRTVHGNRFSPNLQSVFDAVSSQLLAIKVAPATPVEDYFPDQMNREWIGDRRECKQQILWSGNGPEELVSRYGQRTATKVDRGHAVSYSASVSSNDRAVDVVDDVMNYLYEPHPTVLAARLTDSLAREFNLRRTAKEIPYLFADEIVRHGLLTGFQVLAVTRLDMKTILQSLRHYDIGQLELKRRGVDQVTAGKFSKFKSFGDQQATLFLTRVGRANKRKAILARRLTSTI